jgi:hypothetical protein
MEWLKVLSLSSNPSTVKKKKKKRRANINQRDCIKPKSTCTAKEITSRIKSQATEWKKIDGQTLH